MMNLADKIKAAKPGDVIIHEYAQPPKPWWTNSCDLWLLRGEERIYCPHGGVTRVDFRTPVLGWNCGGCTERSGPEDMYCGNCRELRSHARSTVSDGEFTVRTVLPYNGFLWDLVEGDVLAVRHIECGRRDVWENGEWVVTLTVDGHGHDCSLTDLVLPERDDHVRVQFTPTGMVEVFRKWHERSNL